MRVQEVFRTAASWMLVVIGLCTLLQLKELRESTLVLQQARCPHGVTALLGEFRSAGAPCHPGLPRHEPKVDDNLRF